MWQNGEICQVSSTEAFTSSWQACDGTLVSSLPRHTCLFATHTLRKTVLSSSFFPPRALVLHTRLSAWCFPSLWAWHCVLPLLSVVATGTLWHAGGWHLRRKPRVLLLLHLPTCSFEPRCALWFWQLARNFSLRDVGVWGPACFVVLFFTHCATYLLSLIVLDYFVGIRLEVLRNDNLLVLRM